MTPALLAAITVGLIYSDSEAANKIVVYFGLSPTILITLSLLFIVLLIPALRREPIFVNFALKIKTKLRKSYQYMFYLAIALMAAGYASHSSFSYAAAGLMLILGLTFLYFYYCANLILEKNNNHYV